MLPQNPADMVTKPDWIRSKTNHILYSQLKRSSNADGWQVRFYKPQMHFKINFIKGTMHLPELSGLF